jgi:hypothetical protein
MSNTYKENRTKQYYIKIGGQFKPMTVVAGRVVLVKHQQVSVKNAQLTASQARTPRAKLVCLLP